MKPINYLAIYPLTFSILLFITAIKEAKLLGIVIGVALLAPSIYLVFYA